MNGDDEGLSIADLVRSGQNLVIQVEGQPMDFYVLATCQVLRDGTVIGAMLSHGGSVSFADFLPSGIVIFETGVHGNLDLDGSL